MNTENEKVVRDQMREAFETWVRKDKSFHWRWLDRIEGDPDYCAGDIQRLWEAWQAALQSQSNTDGWVMVPVEPTSDQVNDGADAMRQAIAMFNRGRSVQTAARRVYEAMLSAAPKAPQQVSNTPQDGKVRKALEDLLEQFDPRNHQSFCECDPSVGYQCAACKFPSIPAVIAAHEALATPPQSGEAVNPAKVANIVRNFHRNSCYPEAMGAEVDSAVDAIMRLIANATPTATASQESAPTSDQTGREPT